MQWPYDDIDFSNPPNSNTILPKFPTVEGYTRSGVDTRLVSMPSSGPSKIRNRFTAAPIKSTERYLLRRVHLGVLDDFYKSLGNGSERFIKPDPLTRLDAEYRFVSPITINPLSGDLFEVVLDLEIMPS